MCDLDGLIFFNILLTMVLFALNWKIGDLFGHISTFINENQSVGIKLISILDLVAMACITIVTVLLIHALDVKTIKEVPKELLNAGIMEIMAVFLVGWAIVSFNKFLLFTKAIEKESIDKHVKNAFTNDEDKDG